MLPAISSSYAAIAADITAMSSSSDIVLSALTEGVAATGAAGAGALAGAASGAGLAFLLSFLDKSLNSEITNMMKISTINTVPIPIIVLSPALATVSPIVASVSTVHSNVCSLLLNVNVKSTFLFLHSTSLLIVTTVWSSFIVPVDLTSLTRSPTSSTSDL